MHTPRAPLKISIHARGQHNLELHPTHLHSPRTLHHHEPDSLNLGRLGAPPSTPKGSARHSHPLAPLLPLTSDDCSNTQDDPNDAPKAAELSQYLRQRRAPITDPALDFGIVHEAVEALEETGWNLGQDPCPVVDLHQDLVSKDVFKRTIQVPLSLLWLPAPPAATPPRAAVKAEHIESRGQASVAPVPRFKHCELFASAVSQSSTARYSRTTKTAGEGCDCVSSRSGQLSSRRGVDADAAERSPAVMHPAAAPAAHSARVHVSHFDFRSLLFLLPASAATLTPPCSSCPTCTSPPPLPCSQPGATCSAFAPLPPSSSRALGPSARAAHRTRQTVSGAVAAAAVPPQSQELIKDQRNPATSSAKPLPDLLNHKPDLIAVSPPSCRRPCSPRNTAAAPEACCSQQWVHSGVLQFPGVLWASGDARLLSLRGLTRVKQHKRERFSRPLVVVSVKKRKPVVAQRLPAVEATAALDHACKAVDVAEAVVYKPVEELIEVIESEDTSTVTIHIVMHNGKRLRAAFRRSDTLQHLRDHIAAHTPQEGAVFTLWGGRPRALLTNMSQLLCAGNLMMVPVHQRVPNAVLQAAVRRLVARERYVQRLETEASVLKLSATESRLRRLTEEMRDHSTIMQEAHEQEAAEEARQERLLAVIQDAVARKKRQGRRVSKASNSSGSYSKGSRMEDEEFSEDWSCSVSDVEAKEASENDGEEGPGTPVKISVASQSPSQAPSPSARQLPLSPKVLQRLHAQVAGLNLLSPLRRRIHSKLNTNNTAGAAAALCSPQKPCVLPDDVPLRSPLHSSRAVSDAERLKRMWNEQRLGVQLRAQGARLQLKSLAPGAAPIPTRVSATGLSAPAHVVPSVTAVPLFPPPANLEYRELPDDDNSWRFSYRESMKQLGEAERSRRRLRM